MCLQVLYSCLSGGSAHHCKDRRREYDIYRSRYHAQQQEWEKKREDQEKRVRDRRRALKQGVIEAKARHRRAYDESQKDKMQAVEKERVKGQRTSERRGEWGRDCY